MGKRKSSVGERVSVLGHYTKAKRRPAQVQQPEISTPFVRQPGKEFAVARSIRSLRNLHAVGCGPGETPTVAMLCGELGELGELTLAQKLGERDGLS